MTDLAAIKAELRTLLEKATPGPWKVDIDVFESDPPYYFSVLVEGERSEPGTTLAPFFVSETNVLNEVTQESSQRALDSQEGRDAALIVAAVNALPALLADTPSVEPGETTEALDAALRDMTGAYHHERSHAGSWDQCQRPRCQNARLALEGRGPFANIAACGDDSWDRRYACVKPAGHPTPGPGLTDHDYQIKRAALLPTQASDSPEKTT